MSGPLLVQRHEGSGRTAIVADEDDSVWLYLTRPGESAIAADCWLFNRIAAPPQDVLRSQLAAYRARALPPPAPADLVAPGGLRDGPLEDLGCRLVWSKDGNAVAARAGGELLGYIDPEQQRGCGRFLLAGGPWGTPLNLGLYEELFPGEQG